MLTEESAVIYKEFFAALKKQQAAGCSWDVALVLSFLSFFPVLHHFMREPFIQGQTPPPPIFWQISLAIALFGITAFLWRLSKLKGAKKAFFKEFIDVRLVNTGGGVYLLWRDRQGDTNCIEVSDNDDKANLYRSNLRLRKVELSRHKNLRVNCPVSKEMAILLIMDCYVILDEPATMIPKVLEVYPEGDESIEETINNLLRDCCLSMPVTELSNQEIESLAILLANNKLAKSNPPFVFCVLWNAQIFQFYNHNS